MESRLTLLSRHDDKCLLIIPKIFREHQPASSAAHCATKETKNNCEKLSCGSWVNFATLPKAVREKVRDRFLQFEFFQEALLDHIVRSVRNEVRARGTNLNLIAREGMNN